MSMSDREKLLRRALLNVLQKAGLTPEENLFIAVGHFMPGLLRSEFTLAVKDCEERGWIHGVKGTFGDNKWQIRDEGRLALAEM